MIETFSDLARLLDDGWRITGIRADSDGDKQRFRFEVEAQRTAVGDASATEQDFRALLVRMQETQAGVLVRRGEFSVAEIDEAIQNVQRLRMLPAITPEGWEIGSGFAEFLHSVGHGALDGDE